MYERIGEPILNNGNLNGKRQIHNGEKSDDISQLLVRYIFYLLIHSIIPHINQFILFRSFSIVILAVQNNFIQTKQSHHVIKFDLTLQRIIIKCI